MDDALRPPPLAAPRRPPLPPPASARAPDDLRAPAAPPAAPAATGRRALARRALAAALALGALGDALLRGPWGLNLLLLAAALVGALAWLARRRGRPVTVGAAALGALALAFAAAVAWRDAGMLVLLNVLALWSVLCALAAALLHGDALPVDRAGPLDYALGAARVAGQAAAAAPALAFAEARVQELAAGGARTRAGTFARGAAVAAPALLVFAALFASADAAFGRLLGRLVAWDVGDALGHAAVAGVMAWGIAGYLHAAFFGRAGTAPGARPATAPAGAAGYAIGAREVCVAVALVDALFLAFVAVQLGWLFGGAPVVAAGGTSYAEYARRGFFELVTAAALVLPTLLLAHARVAADPAIDVGGARRAFRAAAGLLVALVLVVLVSAADRMRLYVAAYGLTEARLYAAAFMGWLGVAFAWAAVALLRGRPASFALGALAAAWAWVLALDVANPDARVVGVNAARVAGGRAFDAAYVTRLSADAAPALAARALPALLAAGKAREACAVAEAIVDAGGRWDEGGRLRPHGDWRSWSVARARAFRAAQAMRARDTTACAVPPHERRRRLELERAAAAAEAAAAAAAARGGRPGR